MVKHGVIAFDMDGVLVEVGDSYRETIVQTVRHFSGATITRDQIQVYKNAGGWNNDWALSQKILRDLGVGIEYDVVVEQFNKLFLGDNGTPGLVTRERWIAQPDLLERLSRRFHLAIFTGRLRDEADITLKRFADPCPFDPIVCSDHVINPKPHPEGLHAIRKAHPEKPMWYLGDTVDDARSARAARIPFIGVAARDHSRRAELIRLFEQEQAIAVIDDVNQLEGVLA
ncbi:MAG TPA: HAD-IA family hydrolase [Bryobacteraceae bacterium]|nr:HAD-IA family hydrolase [Bryobacteraceae bacterium]